MKGVADDVDDPVLDALWRRVLEAWDDPGPHAALLDHAMRTQSLPEIAGRYRALANDPTKGGLARIKLDRIVMAATEMLMSMRTPKAGKVPLPITLSALAVCALMLGWLALAVWGKR
jgi:hypothetical protein